MKDLILVIDNGTQSLKALVFDGKGNLLAKEITAFKPYYSHYPGWAEQDAEVFWEALCHTCHQLWQQEEVNKNRLCCMALTTQRGTVINVDKKGDPLRPAILWLDQRKTYNLPPLKGVWGAFFRLLFLKDTIGYFQREAEANWIYIHQRDVWDKTHKFLFLSGYLTNKLTGEFVDSVANQVGYIPFDYKRFRWAKGWDWKWRILPVMPGLLPRLIPPGRILGNISKKASEETGIPYNLPLVAAAADKASMVTGSGCIDPSIGCLDLGTTATINVISNKYITAIPLFPPYPSAIPGYYSIEIQVFRGYWMVRWFKEQFGLQEEQEANMLGIEAEALFEKLIEDIPPGTMGLMLQPYWTPGIRLQDPEAKGSIIGFGDIHTRSHLYRSILEGLAYALREGKERIEKRTRIPITTLSVSGGGSKSSKVMQITADVFGLPVKRPHVYETSGLGAAIDAAVGIGIYETFREAIKNMTHTSEVFEPNMQNHRIYDMLYRDVYKKIYGRLKPLYKRIREITGYP